MNPNSSISSSAWVERCGTTAVFAWWILTIGSILL